MIIKLTNCANNHKDSPIYINTEHITCFFQEARQEGGSLTTFVHSRVGVGITWEVEESPSQIMNIIEENYAKSKGCSCK